MSHFYTGEDLNPHPLRGASFKAVTGMNKPPIGGL